MDAYKEGAYPYIPRSLKHRPDPEAHNPNASNLKAIQYHRSRALALRDCHFFYKVVEKSYCIRILLACYQIIVIDRSLLGSFFALCS